MQRLSMILHRLEEGLPSELCRFEAYRPANESNLPVPKFQEMFDRFMNSLFVVYPYVANMRANLPAIQKSHTDFTGREAFDHGEIHLRCQNHDTSNSQFEQALHIPRLALRLVIRIKNNYVVA